MDSFYKVSDGFDLLCVDVVIPSQRTGVDTCSIINQVRFCRLAECIVALALMRKPVRSIAMCH